MESEKHLNGLSDRIAAKADKELEQKIENAVSTARDEILYGDAYHLTLRVKFDRPWPGYGPLTHDSKEVQIPARALFSLLKEAAIECLREGNRSLAFDRFMNQFNELRQSIEEIEER